MMPEVTIALTNFLNDTTHGVNAKLGLLNLPGTGLPAGYTGPKQLAGIVHPYNNKRAAEFKEPAAMPALYVLPNGPVQPIDGEIHTKMREARVPIAIRYVSGRTDAETAQCDAGFTMKAVQMCLADFLDDTSVGYAARSLGDFFILDCEDQAEWPWNEAVGDAVAYSALVLTFRVRDLAPGPTGADRTPAASVTVSGGTVIASQQQLTAVVKDAGLNVLAGRDVLWSSENLSDATVDAKSGLVTFLTANPVTIVATTAWNTASPVSGEIVTSNTGGAWTPAAFGSRLWAWYETDSLANLIGTGFSQLTDLGPAGHHATQGTGSKQPATVNTMNGLRVATFDGADDVMNLPNVPAGDHTIFAVYKLRTVPAGNATPRLVNWANDARVDGSIAFCGGGNGFKTISVSDLRGSVAANIVGASPVLDTNPHQLNLTHDNGFAAVLADYALRVDEAVATLAAGSNSLDFSNNMNTSIGAHGGGVESAWLNFDLAALVIVTDVASAGEITSAEAYFARWGV